MRKLPASAGGLVFRGLGLSIARGRFFFDRFEGSSSRVVKKGSVVSIFESFDETRRR